MRETGAWCGGTRFRFTIKGMLLEQVTKKMKAPSNRYVDDDVGTPQAVYSQTDLDSGRLAGEMVCETLSEMV